MSSTDQSNTAAQMMMPNLLSLETKAKATGWGSRVSTSPDDRWVAVPGGNDVWKCDVEAGLCTEVLESFGQAGDVHGICVTSDGSKVVGGSSNGLIVVWDLRRHGMRAIRGIHDSRVDMLGKGGRLRTVPVPIRCKSLIDGWPRGSRVTEGKLFRRVSKNGARQDEWSENRRSLVRREAICQKNRPRPSCSPRSSSHMRPPLT
jgi:WD40 repeat protein